MLDRSHILFTHPIQALNADELVEGQRLIAEVLTQATFGQVAHEVQLPETVHPLDEAEAVDRAQLSLGLDHFNALVDRQDLDRLIRVEALAIVADP